LGRRSNASQRSNGPRGEEELAANVAFRLKAALNDRDDIGDDLNLIVMLLMSILRFQVQAARKQ